MKLFKLTIPISLLILSFYSFAGGNESGHAAITQHLYSYYPDQLTNPQKKSRNTMAQFGYNLSYFSIPVFPITSFINPDNFGIHSYSQPGSKEKNGSLYTCRGGFIDFSHLRAAIDWTVYLAFSIYIDTDEIELTPEAGDLTLHFKNTSSLSSNDIVELAQKIAFERLEWHEIASWHYHPPFHSRSDQQSAFTPEDTYSNFLGTTIGKKIALRILDNLESRPFAEIATEEIEFAIAKLDPVEHKKQSKMAYDIVDRHKQLRLPVNQRNSDVWWDSRILFRDQRYIFKRDIDLGPEIDPWLVPQANELGCSDVQFPEILIVPEIASTGVSFYTYYDFLISPDTAMFYNQYHKQIHTPIPPFTTNHMNAVVRIIVSEMEDVLSPGFDKRDCADPVPDYKKVKWVGLASLTNKSRK